MVTAPSSASVGGLFLLLWPMRKVETEILVARAAATFAAAVLLLVPALQFSRANIDMLPIHPLKQSFHFLLLYAVLLAPFFASGLSSVTIITRRASEIQRVYFGTLQAQALGAWGSSSYPR